MPETLYDITCRLQITAETISKQLGYNKRNVERWISGEKHVPKNVIVKVLEAFDPEYKQN